jgi:hypothetical protein
MKQRRPSGRGAFKAELDLIRVWMYNNQRRWFTSRDVSINARTLNAMAKRKLLVPSGQVGGRNSYMLRSGGWVTT